LLLHQKTNARLFYAGLVFFIFVNRETQAGIYKMQCPEVFASPTGSIPTLHFLTIKAVKAELYRRFVLPVFNLAPLLRNSWWPFLWSN